MGRPSKLRDHQWEQIGKRLLQGEKAADLAREFGVSKTAISTRFSERMGTVKEIAQQVVETERRVESLPIADQIAVRTLADELKAISTHLAGAAKYSASTAHRLAALANAQMDQIDDSKPLAKEGVDAIKSIAVLTDTANRAAEIPLNLLKANKDSIDDLNRRELDKAEAHEKATAVVPDDDMEAAAAYQQLMKG